MQRLVGMPACQSVGIPSHMLAHAALGKREPGNNLWKSRANERNDASSSALSSQAPTTERPFVLPPVTDEDTRCLLASAIPTVLVQLRRCRSSAPSRAYGVTRRRRARRLGRRQLADAVIRRPSTNRLLRRLAGCACRLSGAAHERQSEPALPANFDQAVALRR
jgi:hypothetical protein